MKSYTVKTLTHGFLVTETEDGKPLVTATATVAWGAQDPANRRGQAPYQQPPAPPAPPQAPTYGEYAEPINYAFSTMEEVAAFLIASANGLVEERPK
jgi:hypothetical protein